MPDGELLYHGDAEIFHSNAHQKKHVGCVDHPFKKYLQYCSVISGLAPLFMLHGLYWGKGETDLDTTGSTSVVSRICWGHGFRVAGPEALLVKLPSTVADAFMVVFAFPSGHNGCNSCASLCNRSAPIRCMLSPKCVRCAQQNMHACNQNQEYIILHYVIMYSRRPNVAKSSTVPPSQASAVKLP